MRGALKGHRALLIEEEARVLDAFLSLPAPQANLLARLLWRRSERLREDIEDAEDRALLPALEERGFVVPVPPCVGLLDLLRVEELRQACRELGLARDGRREQLQKRLEASGHVPQISVLQVLHAGLFRRMERLFFRTPWPDHRVPVLEILGVRRSVDYEPGPAPPLFQDREAMLRFEHLLAHVKEEGGEEELLRFASDVRSELERSLLGRVLVDRASALESSAEPQRAVELYRAALELPDSGLDRAHLISRLVLAMEAAGQGREACLLAREARRGADPLVARVLERSGARMARRLRIDWPPMPPLLQPPVRRIELPPRSEGAEGRRRWQGPEGAASIEDAVVAMLRASGRRALHAEASPWTTLFVLFFRDILFMPLPGVLPVRGLAGPLDLGGAGFYERRREWIEPRLVILAQGGGAELLRGGALAHRGEALAGADWSLDDETLLCIVEGLPGPALATILGRLAREGFAARRGLPDILVLPGAETRWEKAFPAFLPGTLLLAELKGPGDHVRDEQAIWFHKLLGAGLRVELWRGLSSEI